MWPEDVLAKEREIMKAQVIEEGKPAKVADKIVEGKISKYFEENCLVNQVYIRDSKKKIFRPAERPYRKGGRERKNKKVSKISARRIALPYIVCMAC